MTPSEVLWTIVCINWVIFGAYLAYDGHKRHMAIEKRLGDGPFTQAKQAPWPLKLVFVGFMSVTVPIFALVLPAFWLHTRAQKTVDRLWPSAWQKKPKVGEIVGARCSNDEDKYIAFKVKKLFDQEDGGMPLIGFEGVAMTTHDRVQMFSSDGRTFWEPVLEGQTYYCYHDGYFHENKLLGPLMSVKEV